MAGYPAGSSMLEPDLLQWCKRLIATPSVTTAGTRRIAELCASELLVPAGISSRLLPSIHDGSEHVTLLSIVNGREPALTPLVFNTHLDTVPPGDPQLWDHCNADPFAAAIEGDRIYGLGAADTKLDFVAKAASLLASGKPRRTVYLVATFGEERGLRGAHEIVELELLPKGSPAFVGEPSGLKLVTAHKALMVFELSIRFPNLSSQRHTGAAVLNFAGRSAHSSTPNLGHNAILAALDFLIAQPELEVVAIDGGDAVNKVPARCKVTLVSEPSTLPAGATRVQTLPEARRRILPPSALRAAAKFAEALQNFAHRSAEAPGFASPAMTCNIGVIQAAGDALRLEFDLRPPPELPMEQVRRGVQSVASVLAKRFREVAVIVAECRANPGFRAQTDCETVVLALQAMTRAGIPVETSVKAGCTEAGIYAAAGLQPVVFGPGPSVGVIHAPNEFNLLSEVEAATHFYRYLLDT